MHQHGVFQVQDMYGIKPVLYFDYATLEKAKYLVRKHPVECQWFHEIRRELTKDDKGNYTLIYRIKNIYIPEQETGHADVESDPEGIMKLTHAIRDSLGGYTPEFNEIISKTNFWCHSHVNMATGPSGTDDSQFRQMIELAMRGNSEEPQGMLILNKKDQYYTRIWDPVFNLIFTNVPISVEALPSIDMSDIDAALEERVKRRSYTSTSRGFQGQRGNLPSRGPAGSESWFESAISSYRGTPANHRSPSSGTRTEGSSSGRMIDFHGSDDPWKSQFWDGYDEAYWDDDDYTAAYSRHYGSSASQSTQSGSGTGTTAAPAKYTTLAELGSEPQYEESTRTPPTVDLKTLKNTAKHYLESFEDRILAYIEVINRTTSCTDEVDGLMSILDGILEDADFVALHALLFGSDEDLRDLEDLSYLGTDEESVNDALRAKADCWNKFKEERFDPPELVTSALQTVAALGWCDEPEQAEFVIDAWIEEWEVVTPQELRAHNID